MNIPAGQYMNSMIFQKPQDFLGGLKHKIPSAVTCSFLVTFLAGLLIHFFAMTQKFFNYFEMGNIFSHMPFLQPDTVALGRWFMPVATNLFTYFSMPVYNVVLGLVYMAVSAALIISLAGVRSRLFAGMFALCWVSFPGLACVYSYGVNADELTLAVLLAVASGFAFARLYDGEKRVLGVITGAVLLCLSLGAYQPYMSLTIAMIYLWLFVTAAVSDETLRGYASRVLWAVLMLCAGFVLYYAVLKGIIIVTGVSLSDYHGVDSMTSFTPKGVAKGFVYTYIYFLRYFFTADYNLSFVSAFFCVIGAAGFVVLTAGCIRRQLAAGRRMGGIVLLLLLVFLPLGVNAAPFLMADRVGDGVDRYMIFSLMLLWALLAFLMDRAEDRRTEISAVWGGLAALAAASVTAFIICNQAYYRMDAMTQAVESLMNRIAARMESTEGWNAGIPVVLVGSRALINDNYDLYVEELESIKLMPGTFYRKGYSDEAFVQYMRVFLHFPVNEADEAVKARILATDEYKSMKIYPDESAVRIMDGVMVIKLSEEK